MDKVGRLMDRFGRVLAVEYPDGREELWDERMAVEIWEAAGWARLLQLGTIPGERPNLVAMLRMGTGDPVPGLH